MLQQVGNILPDRQHIIRNCMLTTNHPAQASRRTDNSQKVPALQLRNVGRTFAGGRIVAVDDLSLEVFPGEILSILGPSGCGKTTTMRMIAGLDEPTTGDIRVFGDSVKGSPPHLRNVGLVFQTLAIFPHMSVEKNVAFGLRMKKIPAPDIAVKVRDILDLVHLPYGEFGRRMPNQLSGGQLQRVALARTLVTEPALVLFDEPMAALDRRLRDYMAIELRRIQKDMNIAAVYVTHDQETASAMSDRIAVIQSGKLVQIGTPEEVYNKPVNRFVAEFLGDINVLNPAKLTKAANGSAIAHVADSKIMVEDDGASLIDNRIVVVRPEQVQLVDRNSDKALLVGEVIECQFGSGIYRTRIRLSDKQELVANSVTSDASELSVGDPIGVLINQKHARVINP